MPKIIGTGINQVPTNAMLGGLAYQSPDNILVGGAEIENINAINGYIDRTAAVGKSTIFVYDTRRDSDGGAWRKRTSHTSWYNEPPGEYRGKRKEFPSIAVIVGTTNDVIIYDGDDPDLSMWMTIKARGAGMDNQAVLQYVGSPYRVKALNGQLVIGQQSGGDNWGNPALNFISEEIVRADPHLSEGGFYAGGIALRNDTTGSGFVQKGQGYVISNSRIRDIGMRVLPDAIVDPKTGLPTPTIAYAHYDGISVVRADTVARPVYDITSPSGNHNIPNFVDITECGHLIYEQDGSNGKLVYCIPIPTADRTSNGSQNDITDKVVLKPRRDSWDYARFNEPLGTSGGVTDGVSMKGDGHALLCTGSNTAGGGKVTIVEPNFNYKDETRVAFITRDYNTGWMVGGTRAAFCCATTGGKQLSSHNYALDAVDGGSNRLTSDTYTAGATSFQMVDNASSNNGYVNVDMRGLTVGQTYRVSMTRSAHAVLDSGYSHMVQHLNGDAKENPTKFEHGQWNQNNSSSHNVTGMFTAQSVNDDDLVLYANGSTINISDLRIEETFDIEFDGGTDQLNGFGAFNSATGWTVNTWTVSGGIAQGGSGNDSIFRTIATIPGQTYCVSVNVTQLHNTSTLFFYIPHSYDHFPLIHTGWNHRHFVATSSTTTLGVTNLAGTNNKIDDLKVRPADADRAAGQAGGIFAFSSDGSGIKREPVEPGAELLSYYMGKNVQDYLWQGYQKELDFTNEMSLMVWVKEWGSQESLLHRGPDTTRNSQTSFYLYSDAGYDFRFTLTSNGSSEQNFEIQLDHELTGWQFVCFTLKGGTVKGYLKGEPQSLPNSSFSGTNIYSQATNRNGLYIGRGPVGSDFEGKMALLRLSSTAPSDIEIEKIYKDERALFQPNAKCTIAGSSDDADAIEWDSTKEVLHIGTSEGRSDFSGLVRINNTTQTVSTSISAEGGLIAEQ